MRKKKKKKSHITICFNFLFIIFYFNYVIKDVDLLSGDDKKCLLPLLLPHHIQLEDDLLDGDLHHMALVSLR